MRKYKNLRLPIIVFAAYAILAYSSVTSAEDEVATSKLHALFEETWERTLREFPTFASDLGDLRYNDQWRDVSLESLEEYHKYEVSVLKRLKTIDPNKLSPEDRINYRLFQREYQDSVDAWKYRWHLVPLTQRDGIQDASSTADALRFETVKDYEDWIARMNGMLTYMDQTIVLMQRGIELNIVHARIVMERVPHQIERQIVEDPTKSLFYKPFRKFPKSIPAAEQQRLRTQAQTAIRTAVVPAYEKMLTFFTDEYLPACFDRVGVWQIPLGQEFYAQRARKFTTTELTPQEIHDIGLKEVKRIRAEMETIVKEVGWEGTFAEFLTHLRTDEKFYTNSPNELLEAYQAVCRRIDPELPKLFKKLPRIPYGIEAIPAHIAPDTTTAYYRPPSADGRRPGTYFVNLYKPEVRPTYEMEALSLHESVPGHHLQIALAMERGALPEFRRYGGYTAFVEGWALYGEKLGYELGMYEDPYSRFGQLTYEMWRAIRLVVDTGMHSLKWTRQDAIDLFKENTAKTELDIVNEVDRYIAWPGQALAYKIGEIRISELRKRAEQELGDEFDIREFHDVVLRNGAVTLDVLEQNVEAWLKETSTR
ncbi:DUF885 domain-containing protein [Thalassoroseus pseudoceratinae]|uniref:DUF885 domain-containing protein n=1 Tax=Thalassoroseus pseudoceratinae TaxID=2713176 RepID=UPI001F0D977B|nr:DUF885 domain-containing protein [Thalassoroseus pseudoceratinae]